MLQVALVKNEAKEKKPKIKQTNRLADDSNNDTSSDNIQPNTKHALNSQIRILFVTVLHAVIRQ